MDSQYDLIIEPGKNIKKEWAELWEYKELFLFLAWKDVVVRYKQTVIGLSWSLIRPFLTMVVFTVIFGKIAKLPSNGIPYPIMVFAGLLPWQFFSNALTASSGSVISSSGMISKIYFPRIIVPTSKTIVSLIDFIITFVIMIGMFIIYRFVPPIQILLLPFFVILALLPALGVGLWVSSLNVKYRDFQHIIPFAVQLGLYISPVGFSSSVVPEQWRFLYSLNPMVGVIDGFRWIILGGNFNLYLPGFLLSIGIALVLFISGIWFFKKTEKSFADYI